MNSFKTHSYHIVQTSSAIAPFFTLISELIFKQVLFSFCLCLQGKAKPGAGHVLLLLAWQPHGVTAWARGSNAPASLQSQLWLKLLPASEPATGPREREIGTAGRWMCHGLYSYTFVPCFSCSPELVKPLTKDVQVAIELNQFQRKPLQFSESLY